MEEKRGEEERKQEHERKRELTGNVMATAS